MVFETAIQIWEVQLSRQMIITLYFTHTSVFGSGDDDKDDHNHIIIMEHCSIFTPNSFNRSCQMILQMSNQNYSQ